MTRPGINYGFQPGTTVTESITVGAATLFGVAIVAVIVHFDGFGASLVPAVGVTAAAIAAIAVIMTGPVSCAVGVAALTAAGLSPVLAQAGPVTITLPDIFFLGLVYWWARGALGRAQGVLPARRSVPFGQTAAILLLVYSGLTLWKIEISNPSGFETSLVSWLRLVQTAAIAWMTANALGTRRDVRLLLTAIAIGGVVAVVQGLADGGALLSQRYAGTLGPNALGLVSGLVIVISVFGLTRASWVFRAGLVAAGVLGLLMAISVASFVATGIALALGAALRPGQGSAQGAIRAGVSIAVAAVLVLGLVQTLRPETLPGSDRFATGSAAQRLVVGTAGLEIFSNNPVIGVGWRGSDNPELMSSREIANEVRKRFPNISPEFYPDVTPTTVHNTYIQVLADLGIIGFALFAGVILTIGLRTTALYKRLEDDSARPLVFAMGLCLLVAVVWFNDNPLYGGQPETVLPAILVGALAATARITATPSRERPTSEVLVPARDRPKPARGPWTSLPAGAAIATPAASGPAPRDWPLIWPGAGRRILIAGAVVVVAGAVGLLLGQESHQHHFTPSPQTASADAVIQYQVDLREPLRTLSEARAAGLESLRSAPTADGQAQAARDLARAYEHAAAATGAIDASGDLRASNRALVASMERTAATYERLATAADSGQRPAYDAAVRAVAAAEDEVQQLIATAQR